MCFENNLTDDALLTLIQAYQKTRADAAIYARREQEMVSLKASNWHRKLKN